MSEKVNIIELGFDRWLDLYTWLREQGLHNEQKVTLTWPSEPLEGNGDAPDPGELMEAIEAKPDVTLAVNLIKAKAFEEIYDQLPTNDALSVIQEMIKAPKSGAGDVQAVQNFLSNLPTRAI